MIVVGNRVVNVDTVVVVRKDVSSIVVVTSTVVGEGITEIIVEDSVIVVGTKSVVVMELAGRVLNRVVDTVVVVGTRDVKLDTIVWVVTEVSETVSTCV